MTLGPWRPGNNGAGKRIWFLHRDAPEIADRYRLDSRGVLIRYASHETAAKAAAKLNNLDYGSDIIKVSAQVHHGG